MNKQTNRNTTADAATGPSKIEGLTSMQVLDEQAMTYILDTSAEQEAEILTKAEAILQKRFERLGQIGQPSDAAQWLRVRFAPLQSEVFAILFLDNRHRILGFEEMFRGTLDGASVPPRECVRAALKYNAAAVVLAHNHPSGVAEPSAADVALTSTLKQAFDLIGVRVLDHLIVGEHVTSLCSRGLC